MSLHLIPHLAGPARRLVLVHRTGFHYDTVVGASYNEARMTPLTTARQTTLDSSVRVSPVTWTHSYVDYWGTQVTAFDVLVPHSELTVISSATVELYPAVDVDTSAGWETLAAEPCQDQYVEFLKQTPMTDPATEVVELARSVSAGRTPAQAAEAVCGELRDALSYVPGITSVRTDAVEAWANRKGVCQDFAHLALGALRSLGIPARYVSGYVHPDPDAELGRTVEGQGHAWVEWWAGDWFAYDVTHGKPVGVDHVAVAKGRDYVDVTPLKGVYSGAATSELFVRVDITRIA